MLNFGSIATERNMIKYSSGDYAYTLYLGELAVNKCCIMLDVNTYWNTWSISFNFGGNRQINFNHSGDMVNFYSNNWQVAYINSSGSYQSSSWEYKKESIKIKNNNDVLNRL